MAAFLPVSFCHWALMASSAFLRLAANVTAAARLTSPASHLRLDARMSVLLAGRRRGTIGRYKYTIPSYIPPAIARIVETLRTEILHARVSAGHFAYHFDNYQIF